MFVLIINKWCSWVKSDNVNSKNYLLTMNGNEFGLLPLDFTNHLFKPLRNQQTRLFEDRSHVGCDEENLRRQGVGGQLEAARRLASDFAAATSKPRVIVIGIRWKRTPGGHPGDERFPKKRKKTRCKGTVGTGVIAFDTKGVYSSNSVIN